jgi:hypothetical protein
MRENPASDHPLDVIYLPLGSGTDALVLSRFVHQVLEQGLCTSKAVVVEIKKDSIATPSILDLLNMAVARMVNRHLFVVILAVDQATRARLRPTTFPNIGRVRLAESEGDVALLLLNNAWETT